VAMANVAQLVNCLQSLFLAHEDKFCVTPTYHVCDLYTAHQGARSVRAVVAAPKNHYTRNGAEASMRGLSASASVNGNQLTLTVTNPSFDRAREVEIGLRGGSARSAGAVTLAAADPHAHNSFAEPRTVEPRAAEVALNGNVLVHMFPPASLTRITVELGG